MKTTAQPVPTFPQFKRRSFGFFLVSLAFALLIVTSLVWCMQYLIKAYDDQVVRARHPVLKYVKSRPDPPQPPRERMRIEPPPLMKQPVLSVDKWSTIKGTGLAVFIPSGFDGAKPVVDIRPGSLATDSDYMHLAKSQPIYPIKALEQNVEGYCVVTYTISKNGSTKHVVVDKPWCTSTLFYKASVSAARRFKYRPRIVDGESVEVDGVRNKFTFKIDR